MVGLNDNNMLSRASLDLGHMYIFLAQLYVTMWKLKLNEKNNYPIMNYHMAYMPR
jgi:hypothetical protein